MKTEKLLWHCPSVVCVSSFLQPWDNLPEEISYQIPLADKYVPFSRLLLEFIPERMTLRINLGKLKVLCCAKSQGSTIYGWQVTQYYRTMFPRLHNWWYHFRPLASPLVGGKSQKIPLPRHSSHICKYPLCILCPILLFSTRESGYSSAELRAELRFIEFRFNICIANNTLEAKIVPVPRKHPFQHTS